MKTLILVLLSALSFQLSALALDLNLDKSSGWSLDATNKKNGKPLFNTVQGDGSLALAFIFATYPKGYDGYLLDQQTTPLVLQQSQTLTLHVRVTVLSGAPVFHYFDNCPPCCQAANIRPFFQSGKLFSNDLQEWWSFATQIYLAPGEFTVSVSLDPANWSSTFGEHGDQYPTQFANSLAHVTYIGATMGGGCNFGHGVGVTGGSAQLEVLDYSIE